MGSIPSANSGVISRSLPWCQSLVTSLDAALSHKCKPVKSEDKPLEPLLSHDLNGHCCVEVLKVAPTPRVQFFLFETWLQTIVLCSVGYLVYGDKILSSSTGRFHSGEGPNHSILTIANLGQKTPENHFFGRSTRSYPIFLDVQHQVSSILAKYQHEL